MPASFLKIIRPRVVEFLDSLFLSKKRETHRKLAQVTFHESDYSESSIAPKNHTSIYQTKMTKMVFREFITELVDVAGPRGHPVSEDVFTALLAVCLSRESSGEKRTSLLEAYAQSFRPHLVYTYYIFDQVAGIKPTEIDGVIFGPIDVDRCKSRLNRTRISGAQEHAKEVENRYGLEFPETQITIASLHDKSAPQDDCGPHGSLEFNYYANVAKLVLEESWDRLAGSQSLAAVRGQEVLRVNPFRETTLNKNPRSFSVFIDDRTGKGGYFIKLVAGYGDSHLPEDQSIFTAYREFQNGEGRRLSESGDYRIISKAARAHQQALEYLQKGRTDDAILYGCICLEILIGDDEVEGKSNRLAERASVLIMKERNAAQVSAHSEIKNLYNCRSEFVHTGQPVKFRDAHRMVEIAEKVLRSAYTALGSSRIGRLQWCQNLEKIALAARGKDKISEPGKFYAENGIT